jgi:short subunit dehydrogenase-like uncharacterized protein
MSERDYDIVLFGATGFTGELTAQYLARHLPEGARWALAGRSQAKLEAVRERLAEAAPPPVLVVANVEDADSITALAASARVVVSTVGPYLKFGEPLVAACAAAGTDYLDLTGEPEFVDRMYLAYHAQAVETGARLVHSCGFDSIPYDLGALYTVSQLPDDAAIRLQGYGLMVGSVSGGTYHSLVGALGRIKESGRVARQRNSVEKNSPDGGPSAGRHVHGAPGKPHREPIAGGWVVPAPTIDPQVVLRSARGIDAYGPDFSYSHYIVTGGLVKTGTVVGGIAVLAFFAQLEQTRKLALMLKSPGDGPTEEQRAKAFFRARFVAQASGGGAKSGRRLVTEVTGGDPGYGETSKMLAESALAMAFDQDLPSAGRGGQMTTAVAFGQRLIDRLVAAGINFRVVE